MRHAIDLPKAVNMNHALTIVLTKTPADHYDSQAAAAEAGYGLLAALMQMTESLEQDEKDGLARFLTALDECPEHLRYQFSGSTVRLISDQARDFNRNIEEHLSMSIMKALALELRGERACLETRTATESADIG